MRLMSVLIWLVLLVACSGSEPPSAPTPPAPVAAPTPPSIPEDDLYVLAVGGNGFKAEMNLSALRSRYGAEAVVEQQVPLGEGETEAGALIHPDDPTRRAFVYFVDGNTAGTISTISVRDRESRWSGPMGLRLGMTSRDLERLNGKPFRFLGFDWDYGGYVSNWTDGALATALLAPGQLAVRLSPPELGEGKQLAGGYPRGDGEFTSDIPPVREQPPVVIEMGLGFVPAGFADATTLEPDAGQPADATLQPAD
jgi:hypothetical protein